MFEEVKRANETDRPQKKAGLSALFRPFHALIGRFRCSPHKTKATGRARGFYINARRTRRFLGLLVTGYIQVAVTSDEDNIWVFIGPDQSHDPSDVKKEPAEAASLGNRQGGSSFGGE